MNVENQQKILCLLERLKKEWDLVQKKDFIERNGFMTRVHNARVANISPQKHSSWVRECGIADYYELESIMNILCQEGLIVEFRSIHEYE